MTDRDVMQQSLDALGESLGMVDNLHCYGICMDAITALKAALEQPEQEPTPWRDMVVVSLVREGIDKHKARELADHFAAQPEPVAKLFGTLPVYDTAAQPEQEPVAYYHPHKGFYWAKPTHISAPTVVDVPPVPLYVKWIAAQRPWQGLTDEDKKKIATAAGCTEDDDGHIVTEIFRLAEAKLKERNT